MEENTIKDVRNLFRLKKEKKMIPQLKIPEFFFNLKKRQYNFKIKYLERRKITLL